MRLPTQLTLGATGGMDQLPREQHFGRIDGAVDLVGDAEEIAAAIGWLLEPGKTRDSPQMLGSNGLATLRRKARA